MSLSLPSIGRDNRYRTIAEIGRGGMAIVYKAEDTLLGRLVAIKIIPPKLTKSKDALRRFIREARAYARLDHPGIIRLYDMGEDEGTQFIVMEYLDGSTLRDYIESRDSIDLPAVQKYFHQICAAIDFAHKKKVVHRDIKPENIMVVDDRVKVMDFGLACLDDFHSQTQAGALMGTIAYFSPEQARGEPGDVRSDIYSLGALLFEMLTNHLPFEATSVTEMIQKHLDAQPPLPSSLNIEVAPAFDKAVLKAMEKDPEKRFQTVQEFLDALAPSTGAEKQLTAGIAPLLAVTTGLPAQERPSDRDTKVAAQKTPAPPPVKEETREGEIRPEWDSYRHIREKIKRDEALLRESAKGRELPCPRCGHTNAFDAKFCDNCGVLISGAAVSPSSREAGTHLEAGLAFLDQGSLAEAVVELQKAALKDSSSGEALYHLGRAFQEQNKLELALGTLEKAVVLDSSNAFAFQRMGDIHGKLGDYQDACAKYREAVARAPENVQFRCQLGYFLYKSGDIREAVSQYRSALEIDPRNAEARRRLGHLLSTLNQVEEAITEYQQVVKDNPRDAEVLEELGTLFEKGLKGFKAVEALSQAVSVDPSSATAYLKLGRLYEKQKDPAQAQDQYTRAVECDPSNVEAHFRLGDLYHKQQKTAAAIESYEKVVALEPKFPEARKKLGDLYLETGRMDLAEFQYEWAANLFPNDPEVHGKLGMVYYRQDKTHLSITEYRKAVSLDPYNPEYHENLGTVYFVEKDLELAAEELKKAVALDGQNLDYRKALGVTFEAQGRYDLAAKEYQNVIDLNPTDALAYGLLGRSYFSQGLLNSAIYQYHRSLELDSGSHMIHSLLGKAYLKQGKLDQAIETLKRTVQLVPRGLPKEDAVKRDEFRARAQSDLAEAYLAQGQTDLALESLNEASRHLPKNPRVHHLLCLAHEKRQENQKAITHIKTAIRNDQGHGPYYLDLARLLVREKEPDLALQALQKAIALDPQSAAPHEALGDFYLSRNTVDGALAEYRAAIVAGSPNADKLHWTLGNMERDLNDLEGAVSDYREALALCPENWAYARDLAACLQSNEEALQVLVEFNARLTDDEVRPQVEEEMRRIREKRDEEKGEGEGEGNSAQAPNVQGDASTDDGKT